MVPKTEACRVLLEKWRAARGDNLLPCRADIDPDALKRIMPHVAILESREPGIVMIRLAGTNYRDILGFEPTGQDLIALTPVPYRRLRAYRAHMVVSWPCASLAEISITFSNRVSDSFEFIALPLATEGTGRAEMAICTMASIGGRRWQNEGSAHIVEAPAEIFEFVDVGAGVPAATERPDDFLRP